ncbi:MAG: DUF3786 domain-containing protein [Candidatus Brocadiia bacterium]
MAKPEKKKREQYESALRKKSQCLKETFDPERFEQLGADMTEDGNVRLKVLKWHFVLDPDSVSVTVEEEETAPRTVWKILFLDYLNSQTPSKPSTFEGFTDFGEARGYQKAYDQRVTQRLTHGVGAEEATLREAAEALGGAMGEQDPLRYLFRFFPNFEMQVVRQEGDEELPSCCEVLFSDNALDVISIESMIVAAERLVSVLEGKGPCG